MKPGDPWTTRPVARFAAVLLAVTLMGACKGRQKARRAPPGATSTHGADSAPPRQRPRPQAQAQAPKIEPALRRGLEALCKLPEAALLFDSSIAVAAVARGGRWPSALASCRRRIIQRGLKDHDHPLSFLIDPGYRSKVNLEHLRKLPPPKPGAGRAPVNRIVHRAAHCRAVGFPAAAFAYVIGPMRDQGGYHSTHAIWALLLIRD